MTNSERPVRIGFLSVAHPHVYTRADILADEPGVELVAASDDYDEAGLQVFLDRYGVERCASTGELLARDDIDAVIIESWTQDMASNAVAALEAGKAVLLEKPGANNSAAMRQVVDAVERTGGYLSVGYMVRQNRSQERLRRLLAAGDLGRVTVARFHVSVPAPDAVTPWFNLETDIGGVLFEDGCHMLDLIVDLFGRPTSVTAAVPKYDDLTEAYGHRYEDAAACTLSWPDKVATLSLVGWEANDWLETWELAIFGDRGSVYAGPLPERLHVFRKDGTELGEAGWTRHDTTQFNVSWLDHEAKHVWHAVQHRGFYRAELARFVNDVRTGGTPEIPARHALDVIETIEAFYASSRERRAVDL